MARNKSAVVVQLEYFPIRALFQLMRILPWRVGAWVCRCFLNTILIFIPKRRKLMDANLAACFPDMTPDQRLKVAQDSLDHLAHGVSVYAKIPGFILKRSAGWLTPEGFEHLETAQQQGRGVICFTAHYGFWELMAIYTSILYKNVSMIVRPLDNPKLDTFLTMVRSSGGGTVIPHRQALKEGIRCLRKNGVLGILIDQNFYKGGIFVDFFGRLAATTSIVSLLARRTNSIVLPMHNAWEPGKKIRVICEAPFALSQNPDVEQAIAEDTQRMTQHVEGWIRQDPSQWLWLHNRWKRKPEAGDVVYSEKSGRN